MDKPTFINVFLVWLPDLAIYLTLMLLVAGEKKFLDVRKKTNLFKFVLSICVLLIVMIIERPFVPNFVFNMLILTIVYLLMLVFVYKIELYRAMFSIAIVLLISITMENMYTLFLITYVFEGLDDFLLSQWPKFFAILPLRLLQIALIVFLFKYYIVFVSTKLNRKINIILTSILMSITLTDCIIVVIFHEYFNLMTVFHRIMCFVVMIIITLFNFMVLKLVFEITKWTIESGSKQYHDLESDAKWLFFKIDGLLQSNNTDEAKLLISRLKDKLD